MSNPKRFKDNMWAGLLITGLALSCAHPSAAEVRQLTIQSHKILPTKGGPKGDITYEVLSGYFDGGVDPEDRRNSIITDIKLAPRDEQGRASYRSVFTILKPVDMSQATGVLYDMIPNRGNGEPLVPDPDGHVHVVAGWQGDIAPRPGLYSMTVPVAKNSDGSPVTAPAFVRFFDMPDGISTLPLISGLGVGVASPTPLTLDTSQAHLFYQTFDRGPQIPVPGDEWVFADCSITPFPGVPDSGKVCLRNGFDSKLSYGLTYIGKDPLVLGLGFAATRDLVSFLRYNETSGNPLRGTIHWAITTGTSQSGNYVRSFIHLGFNEDEQGRIVFDGANPNIAARQVPLNVRFAVPGGAAGQYELGSEGILWWSPYEDHIRGLKKAGLLSRCGRTNTCPKVVETFTSAEIWNLRMSPDLVGPDAKSDIPLPAMVRRYYFPGFSHTSGSGEFTSKTTFQAVPKCQLPDNTGSWIELWRAQLANLVAWVKDGVEPPQSMYPTLKHGDLVKPAAQAMGFPRLPGNIVPDGLINAFVQQDLGEAFIREDLSGVPSVMPPRYVGTLQSRVPRVNHDGNETSGVLSVQLRVPLGTYTGWNARAEGYDKGKSCLFQGAFIPFAKTKSERLAMGDPRLSLEERYGSHDAFVRQVEKVTADMVAQRSLLPRDADVIVQRAKRSSVLVY